MTGPGPLLFAALWMTGAIASFSVMAVAGREVADTLDTFELLLYRSLIGLVIVLVTARIYGTFHQITTDKLHIHLIRNIGHFTGQNLWFFAVTVIPLAQVFALEFTSPLWVLVLAPLVLGEKLTRTRAIAAGLGFAGVMIITRPGLGDVSPGTLAAALAAIGFAVSAIFTRFLTRSTTITCILFWLTAMQSVFGLLCAGFDGDIALPTIASLPWLILVSLGGLVAHFCLTKALTLAPASVVIPIDFTRLPLIALVGLVFYGEKLDPWILLGAVIIIGANVYNLRSEGRQLPR